MQLPWLLLIGATGLWNDDLYMGMRNCNFISFWLILAGFVSIYASGCVRHVAVPEKYKESVARAPVVIDGIVIKDYGGGGSVNIVDVLVQNVLRNGTGYRIPKIITLEYPSSEIREMDLSAAQHARLYIKPVVLVDNPYRWIRIWQYPSQPQADKEWVGLFQAGRWESTASGPWPVPRGPLH